MEGITSADRVNPDVIICDVNLPGKDGFEIAEALNYGNTEEPVPFIFLTARTDINDLRKGMDLGADDYVFKPFRAKEIVEIVERRLERLNRFRNSKKRSEPDSKLNNESRIILEYKNNTELVKLNDIIYIEAESEYSRVFTSDGKKILVRRLLKDWMNILPENNFLRVHRSSIINLNAVVKIERGYNKNLLVKLKDYPSTIIVSQKYSSELKKKFGS